MSKKLIQTLIIERDSVYVIMLKEKGKALFPYYEKRYMELSIKILKLKGLIWMN